MTRKWKLCTKMTLWFALSVSVIVGMLFGAVYGAMAVLLEHNLREDLALAVAQIGAQVEQEGSELVYENETPIAQEISYYVMEANGSELFSHGPDITAFDAVPIAEQTYTQADYLGEPWLLLDAAPVTAAGDTLWIRAAAPCTENRRTLRTMSMIFGIVLPLAAAIAAVVGHALTRGALRPIRQIIACANEISEGNFTRRVPASPSRDELGELTATLNRMLDAQESSIRRERQFTSDASHELRTPVAVMLATAENLKLPAAQARQSDILLTECHRMQHLIEQMLMLTRAQEGKYHLLPEDFSLREVVEGVSDTFAEQMQQKQMAFQCDIPENLVLHADQSLITRLMLNLVENAVKYGREAGHIVCAATECNQHCEMELRDDGVGISAEALPHVFDRFYRADTVRDRSGTGLGLSIVRWIVQAHQGQITIQSTEGCGTTVYVRLPMYIAETQNQPSLLTEPS